VLVLHEWLGDHTNWEPVLPWLDCARFTTVLADLRGYGLSRDVPGRFTLDEAAGDVLELADTLGFARFHLVGHSMSAMIGQKVAAVARHRVASLVAVTPVPASGFPADAATRAAMAGLADDDEALRRAIDLRTGGRYHRAWLDARLARARRAAGREVMLGYLAMFTGPGCADEVQGLTLPVLAIVGEHDLPIYREDSVRARFGSWYPGLEIAVCPAAGHYPMLETPVRLAALIETFLVDIGADIGAGMGPAVTGF
jgi:pimeloyl-ACP methyl ester carboxylesterase